MTSGGNGSRLASRSSSAFSLSLCRLDGLVFSLEEDGFLMMRRAEGRQTDRRGRTCVWGQRSCTRLGYKNHLATWPSRNLFFFFFFSPGAEARWDAPQQAVSESSRINLFSFTCWSHATVYGKVSLKLICTSRHRLTELTVGSLGLRNHINYQSYTFS